jgi:hypothetical protein
MEDKLMKTKATFRSLRHTPKLFVALALAAILALAGCSPAEPPQTPPAETPVPEIMTPAPETANPTEVKYKAILEAYQKALPAEPVTRTPASQEDQTKLVTQMVQLFEDEASTKAIFDLYLSGISKLSPEQADKFTAYAISGMRGNSFEDYTAVEKYGNDPGFFESFLKEAERVQYKYVVLNQDPELIQDPEVRKVVEEAKNQGYYVASSEGMLYYLVDFTEFAKCRNYNSLPMASLIETLAIDSLDPIASDAAMIISSSTLAARTYNIEKMLEEHQNSHYGQYLAVRFKDHMTMLLYGLNNTPTFSYETNRITEGAVDLFKEIQTLEDSFMAELVRTFMEILEANDGIIDEAAREKAKEIFVKMDEKYNVTDEVLDDFGQWMSGNAVAE